MNTTLIYADPYIEKAEEWEVRLCAGRGLDRQT